MISACTVDRSVRGARDTALGRVPSARGLSYPRGGGVLFKFSEA